MPNLKSGSPKPRESVWDLLVCLQNVVQVVQQWLFHTGKAQNHVSVQSMRLDNSRTQCGVLERDTDFSLYWNPKEISSNVGEEM